MFQSGYGIGMPLTSNLGHILNFAKVKTVRGTNGDTGRFQSLIQPVFTIITLDNFSGFRVPLGRAPGTCGNAGFTTDTKSGVNRYDSVLGPLLHGCSGTCGHAPRFFTVKTGHKNIRCPGKASNKPWADLDNFTYFRAWRKPFIAFAGDFTRMTSDALFSVLK